VHKNATIMVGITAPYTLERRSSCSRSTGSAFFSEQHDSRNYFRETHANMARTLYPGTFSSSVLSTFTK
jgi:hypothetical protein